MGVMIAQTRMHGGGLGRHSSLLQRVEQWLQYLTRLHRSAADVYFEDDRGGRSIGESKVCKRSRSYETTQRIHGHHPLITDDTHRRPDRRPARWVEYRRRNPRLCKPLPRHGWSPECWLSGCSRTAAYLDGQTSVCCPSRVRRRPTTCHRYN